MKVLISCITILAIIFMTMPAIASCGACGSGSSVTAKEGPDPDPMTDDSPEEPLDEKVGAGTSGRLPAQGPVGYNDSTGLMDVVPSDFEGDIED